MKEETPKSVDPGVSADDLALEDLARILDGGAGLGATASGWLARRLRGDPRLASRVAALEALDADAGDPGSLWSAVMLNGRVDRLLAAGDWRDPAAALGLGDWEDVFYPELIRIAGARAARKVGGAAGELRERLLAAEARQVEAVLEGFVSRLVRMSPEGAGRALERARRHWERETAAGGRQGSERGAS